MKYESLKNTSNIMDNDETFLIEFDTELKEIYVLLETRKDEVFLISRIRRIKELLRSFGVEQRSLTDQTLKTKWQDIRKYHMEKLGQLEERLAPEGELNTIETLQRANEIQKKDITIADDMLKEMEEMKEIAIKSASSLHENTQKISSTENSLDDLESNLKQSGKYIRAYARGIATDRIIMGFVILIICAIIIVITLKSLGY